MPLEKKTMLPSPKQHKLAQRRQEELAQYRKSKESRSERLTDGLDDTSRGFRKDVKAFNRVKSADKDYVGNIKTRRFGRGGVDIDDNGQITRTKKRMFHPNFEKVERWTADPNEPGKVSRELVSWSTQTRSTTRKSEFDKANRLKAYSKIRKDGRYREVWERDTAGNLALVDFHTKRFRDVGLNPAITQYLVKDDDGKVKLDEHGNRTMIRKQGVRHETYQMDGDGQLALTRRRTRFSSLKLNQDKDGTFASEERGRHFGWLYSKTSRQAFGNEEGDLHGASARGKKSTLQRQVLWDKRANLVDKDGVLTGRTHKFSFVFSKKTDFHNDKLKFVEKKIFGLTISGRKPQKVSEADRRDMETFKTSALKHARINPPSRTDTDRTVDSEKTLAVNDNAPLTPTIDKGMDSASQKDNASLRTARDSMAEDSGPQTDTSTYTNGRRTSPLLVTPEPARVPLHIVPKTGGARSETEGSEAPSPVRSLQKRAAGKAASRSPTLSSQPPVNTKGPDTGKTAVAKKSLPPLPDRAEESANYSSDEPDGKALFRKAAEQEAEKARSRTGTPVSSRSPSPVLRQGEQSTAPGVPARALSTRSQSTDYSSSDPGDDAFRKAAVTRSALLAERSRGHDGGRG